MILPVRALVAFPRCSVCEQLRSGERPSARWSLALLDEFRWQPDPMPSSRCWGRADSPRSGRTDSIYDSDPDLWKLRLDVDGEKCDN